MEYKHIIIIIIIYDITAGSYHTKLLIFEEQLYAMSFVLGFFF